jgi:hypothetical protein
MRCNLRSHYAGTEDSNFAHHEFTIIQCRLQFDPFFSSGKSPLRKQSGILARLPFTHHVKDIVLRPPSENNFFAEIQAQ